MTSPKQSSYISILTISLVIATVFSHLFYFPYFMYKIQFLEIGIVLMGLYLLANLKTIRNRGILTLDKSMIILVLSLVVNLIMHGFHNIGLEIIGSLYLVGLYVVFSTVLTLYNKKELYQILGKAANIGLLLLISIGFIGFIVYYSLAYDRFVLIYGDYPYFGDVFRIRGFSFSPNLYISLLAFFTVLKTAFSKINYIDIVLVMILTLISLTKEGIILLAVLFAIVLYLNKFNQTLGIISILGSGVLYIIFSFFVFSFTSEKMTLNDSKSKVYALEPIYKLENLNIYPTTYYSLFKSGLIMTSEHFLTGIGLGHFPQEIDNHKKRNIFPKRFASHEAHDSYFGIVAQLGGSYIIFLIILFWSIFSNYKRIDRKIRYPLQFYLLFMMIESMSIGSFHFRHYYVFFAIIVVLINKPNYN